jgi:hypothetical protein
MCDKFEPGTKLIEIRQCELAQVGSAVTPASRDVRFRITNPTKKLHLVIHVYARPGRTGAGVAPAPHVYTAETWQLYAVVDDNPEIPLNAAFLDGAGVATPRPLPDSYNVNDGVKIIHGIVHIANNNNQTGDMYKVKCIWEPVDSNMSAAERLHWFALCQVAPDNSGAPPLVGSGPE